MARAVRNSGSVPPPLTHKRKPTQQAHLSRQAIYLIHFALLLPALSFAADFWHVKQPQDWSTREKEKLVTNSPWSTEARVVVKGQSHSAMLAGSSIPSMEQAEQTAPRITVRWESAVPVIEACAQAEMQPPFLTCASKLLHLSGLGDKFAELRKRYYIVSMTNYPKRVLLGDGPEHPQHSPAANEALRREGERLQAKTTLTYNGKQTLGAEDVVVLPVARAFLVVVFFPRTQAIADSNEDISFTSAGEALEVRSRFRPQKMQYNGRLEL